MGSVKKILGEIHLNDREKHHSRLFIDLAENIHIHHREYRTVFGLDEFFEYVDIINKSVVDVRNFLEKNKDYREGEYPTTLMIAGGKDRQLKYLENSPSPNISKYYPNRLVIELQEEFVTDEIHIHYRDFRIALNRDTFKQFAYTCELSLKELNKFESENNYIRVSHPDREIDKFNKKKFSDNNNFHVGVRRINIGDVKSFWYKDILKDWVPQKEFIDAICNKINNKIPLSPIVLSQEKNGDHYIIDGHHRFYAYNKMGIEFIDYVLFDLSFNDSIEIREAQDLLKKFDKKTGYKYSMSEYFTSFIGLKVNRYYEGVYSKRMRLMKLHWRILRKVKQIVMGKIRVYKKFNEAHNF